jgi:hypothetical protein
MQSACRQRAHRRYAHVQARETPLDHTAIDVNSSVASECAMSQDQEIPRLNASVTGSRDNDVDSMPPGRVGGILLDGGVTPATPLPSDPRRAGGFASLPYDSFAEKNALLGT